MIPQLLNTYPIISDQISRNALEVVLGGLQKTLTDNIPGDIVEFGCYIGTTSLFLQRLLEQTGVSDRKTFYAYDSFEGLPEKSVADRNAAGINFTAGALRVSKKQFLEQFRRANVSPPITHKGWFADLTAAQLPDHISFAFLDGDFYQSIIDSLRLVWPRLSAGAVIAIDDYKRETLPGVEQAITDFFVHKPHTLHASHNIAIITL